MAWHKVVLSLEQIEKQKILAKLEHEFEQHFMKAEGPSDMALLSDKEYEGDKISIYFTPGCNPSCDAIISQYQGTECDAPGIAQVILLTGNDDALDLLE